MKSLSLVEKGYHSDEKIMGLYPAGHRMKFCGSGGAFWGGIWGLFFAGMFMTIPVLYHVIVLGYLAVAALSPAEGAVMVGGLGALGAVLHNSGLPKDSVYATRRTGRPIAFW